MWGMSLCSKACEVEDSVSCVQVYPKLFLSGGSMYETGWWSGLVKVWEVIVYNPVMDLQQGWPVRAILHTDAHIMLRSDQSK